MKHDRSLRNIITGAAIIAVASTSIMQPWSAAASECIEGDAVRSAATAQQAGNLALNATATASGRELASQWGPELAVDGDKGRDEAWRDKRENFTNPTASRWSANSADNGWLAVDLGAEANLDHVTVTWGKQFGRDYVIETSADGSNWKQAGDIQHGIASKEITTQVSGSARYVRVRFTARNSTWPVGIWELEVFGTWKGNPPSRPDEGLPSVLPMPVTYTRAEGEAFVLDPESDIVAPGGARAEGEKLAETLRSSTGYSLDVVDASTDDVADIELALSGSGNKEAYAIDASADELEISASDAHGLFNGCQTVYQLFGPWSTASFVTNGPWSMPALHIEDQPRFEYRGIMLDPARSFFTKDEVKQAIDVLSKYKYSYLHLHLADDQGWRVEITNEGREPGDEIDYTALTKEGSKGAMGTTQQQSKPGVPGFYTQEDLREITEYAREHHIKIVPEIDMPGHSQSILHCIPELNTPGSSHDGTMKDGQKIENPKDYIVAPTQTTGAVGGSYLDPKNPATWTFLKHVVGQVAEITDAEYFHFGGDETHEMNKKHPGEAPKFLAKAATMVRDMGLKPIGWNEWAIADMQEGDSIQYWNGGMKPTTDKIKQQGAKGLYSSAAHCYFPQKAGPDVWGAEWATGIADINDFYNYDPAREMGATDEQMLGVESAMWNEHVRSIQDFFFPSFPRALATAEVGWTPQALREGKVNDLRRRIADVAPQLTLAGADFYAKDKLVHSPQVAAADIQLKDGEGTKGKTIAYGYYPETKTSEVTASVAWDDGSTSELTVKQNREYLPSNGKNNNNRAQNGIFELVLQSDAPESAKSGTVTFTARGASANDTLQVMQPVEKISFSDVDKGTAHEADIAWLAANGISSGWDNGDGTFSFRPYETVKRCDMAAFLYRLAGSPKVDASKAPGFADVEADTPHRDAILWMAAEGISTGWGEGASREFRPYAEIARCDMAEFLYRMAGSPKADASKAIGFADVDAGTPHRDAVLWMAAEGISTGWGEGSSREFRPYAQVARCDMAAFLHRMDEKGLVR